ncbi:MAG: hypothetical protein Kow0069_04480 [Promethearchaeota archaeon]
MNDDFEELLDALQDVVLKMLDSKDEVTKQCRLHEGLYYLASRRRSLDPRELDCFVRFLATAYRERVEPIKPLTHRQQEFLCDVLSELEGLLF